MSRCKGHLLRLASFFVISLIICAPAYGQFQAMRLLSGVFEFAGNVIGNIPASCINEDLRVPTQTDYFNSVSGAQITRIENGRAETRSLEEVLNKWVRLRGTDQFTGIALEPVNPDPAIKYRLTVRPDVPSVAASDASSLRANATVSSRVTAYQLLDTFSSDLREIFGENSAAYRSWATDYHARAEWNIMRAPADRSRTIAGEAVSAYKDRVLKGETARETLERASVLKGAKLTAQERLKLGSQVGQTLAFAEAGRNFSSQLETYHDLRAALVRRLGTEDHPLIRKFQKLVFDYYDLSGSLSDGVALAREGLLPVNAQKLDNVPGSRDLVGLWMGHGLSDSEVSALRLVTGADVSATNPRLQNAVLLEEIDDEVYITTKSGSRTFSAKKLTSAELKKTLGDHPRVLARDVLSPSLIGSLAEADITFVGSFDQMLQNPQLPARRPRVILVGSEDEETAGKLYGPGNTATVGKAVEIVKSLGSEGVIVSNADELKNAVDSLGPEDHGALVFHNEGDGALFHQQLDLDRLPLDRITPISCNLQHVDLLRHTTTDTIDLERIVTALKETMDGTAGGKIDVDQFLFDFHDRYSKAAADAKGGKIVAVVAGVAGAVLVLYFVSDPCLYYPADPKCKK